MNLLKPITDNWTIEADWVNALLGPTEETALMPFIMVSWI